MKGVKGQGLRELGLRDTRTADDGSGMEQLRDNRDKGRWVERRG